MKPKRLFKVLVGGRSCHGGDLQWSLPHHDGTRWVPGEWHQVDGGIQICSRGLHGTRDPRKWLKHGCRVFSLEAEGVTKWEGDKFVCSRARLLRPCHHPAWWRRVERFIVTLETIPYCRPDGRPDADWVLFEGDNLAAARDAAWDAARAAARDAARDAAWDAARDAAWDAARAAARDAARAAARAAASDAALMAQFQVCHRLPIDPKHISHVEARWRVWQKGYCLLCDVNGVLYVYAKRRTA